MYFICSIFWRADVAQIEPIVHLNGDREFLRKYLLGEAGLPASVDLVASLLRPLSAAPRVDRLITSPQTQFDHRLHIFVACGGYFRLYTEASLPESLMKYSLAKRQRAFSGPGQQLTELISDNAKASEATGKLATIGS